MPDQPQILIDYHVLYNTDIHADYLKFIHVENGDVGRAG